MGLREAMGRPAPIDPEMQQSAPTGDDMTDEQVLQMAAQFFPDLPPEQVLQIVQQIKDSVGEDLSNSDVIAMINKIIQERQGGTSRFQGLAGKMAQR